MICLARNRSGLHGCSSQYSRRSRRRQAFLQTSPKGKPNACNTLLIHRIERSNDPWSGQIGLPGGRVEKFDGSTREALEREVREEVGLELNKEGELLGLLSVGHPGRRIEMKVQPWVYGLRRRPEVINGPEVQHAFWVSLSKLPSLKGTSEVEIRGTRILVEAFLVDRTVVWGFTYRVLNELLAVPGVLGQLF